jgi:hypothetical protein
VSQLYAVDIYSFGLLALYVSCDGAELFTVGPAVRSLPAAPAARRAAIQDWKKRDQLLGICETLIRETGRYTAEQEFALRELLRATVQTDPQRRTRGYTLIKALLTSADQTSDSTHE